MAASTARDQYISIKDMSRTEESLTLLLSGDAFPALDSGAGGVDDLGSVEGCGRGEEGSERRSTRRSNAADSGIQDEGGNKLISGSSCSFKIDQLADIMITWCMPLRGSLADSALLAV